MSSIAENLREVRKRIDAAAARVGRSGQEVILVAVTKTRTIEEIREAIAAGVTELGENYVQEAEAKCAEIGDAVRWHMIGHLQRNKVRHAVEVFDIIESVDGRRLAEEVSRRAVAVGKTVQVLLEVNISGERTKFGARPDDVIALVDEIKDMPGMRLCGLMAVAPLGADPEAARPYFRAMKQLWDKLPDEQRLFLSMGMTQDFEVAVEEGSNMVRIGTAIFGPRS